MSMRIQNYSISNYKKSFTGYTHVTKMPENISPFGSCISESHMMRDLDSTIFARDYLNSTFKSGGKILVPGCSLFEGYTWAALLNKYNADKRFKVFASDIVPEVIADAKKGVLPIGRFLANMYDYNERYLIKTLIFESVSKNQKEAKKAFLNCFTKTNQTECVYSNLLNPPHLDKNIKYVPKKDVFKDVLNFSVENVFDLDKKYKPESVIAISFRNALYHVLGAKDQVGFKYAKIDMAETLFEKIFKMLKKDGLFLLGALPTEHLLEYPTKNTQVLFQENKFIETSCTKIHELFKNIGFRPLFYEPTHVNIHLPTVWKKI